MKKNKNKNNIKVMSLPLWATFDFEEFIGCTIGDSKRHFGRDGVYFDRYTKECWVEAYGMSRTLNDKNGEYFLYELKMENHRPLRNCEYEALELLLKHKVFKNTKCAKELRDLWYTEYHYRELRNIGRECGLVA